MVLASEVIERVKKRGGSVWNIYNDDSNLLAPPTAVRLGPSDSDTTGAVILSIARLHTRFHLPTSSLEDTMACSLGSKLTVPLIEL